MDSMSIAIDWDQTAKPLYTIQPTTLYMRREEQHKCIQCNATLPWRYKGRQKIYCSDTCRKEYTKNKKKD